VLAVILLLGAYLGATNPYFLLKSNLFDIATAVSVIGTAAAFATYVVIIGGLDLTPVTVFVMAGIIVLQTLNAGWPVAAVIIIAVLAGGAIGSINGLLIARFGRNPVIVTLGVNFVFTGLAFVITNGNSQLITNNAFLNLWASSVVAGFPLTAAVMLGIFLLAFLILRYTRLGIYINAIGGNAAAARLNGIGIVKVRFTVYVLAGLAAGLAGVMSVGISGSVAPFGALSESDLLYIIAAIVIGGTSLAGGRGSVWGTLLGVILFGIVANGLVLKNISSYYQPVIIGAVLLVAVLVERVREGFAVEQ
jgi:ribose/xylose/arabinose/galactoside ABC-type transport system permease subunit